MNKTIKIECTGTDTKPLDELLDFQDGIKKLSQKNLEKLTESILRYGFSAPFFIWKHKDELYKLDGHQRGLALKHLRDEKGYSIPDLPVVYIEADTKKQAREKLLHITSQYGEFDKKGLDLFIMENKIDVSNLLTVRLTDTELKIVDDKTQDEKVKHISMVGDAWQFSGHVIFCVSEESSGAHKKMAWSNDSEVELESPMHGMYLTPRNCDLMVLRYIQWCMSAGTDYTILRNGEEFAV